MKRSLIVAAIIALLAGCNQPSVPESRAEAYERWDVARCQVLYGVAKEHWKIGQLQQAADKLREAVALNETSLGARILLGKVLIEQGHYRQATEELSKARARAPKSAEVLYLMGVAQEKAGQLEEALASYRRSYALDTSSLAPVLASAEVLVALGRIDQAKVYIESYLPQADKDPGLYELAGRVAMMAGEHTKAADYYDQAQDLDHKNLRYKELLARAQYLAGRHADAAETLEYLTRQSPYKAPTWVYTMLGDCCLMMNRLRQSRSAYQIAADRAPQTGAIWTGLARAALALQEGPQAVLAARQALQLDARDLDAALVLGAALLRTRHADQAVRTLTRAAAIHPRSPTLQCLLGRAHAATGNGDEATRCYLAALRLDPTDRLARELLDSVGPRGPSRVD